MDQNQKVAQVLSDAATALRKVAGERDIIQAKNTELNIKVAAYERRVQAEKVAAQMHQKGLNTDVDFQSLVSDLEKKAAEGKLATIEEAVDMVGPDMGMKTASLNDHSLTGAGESDFERYLFGAIG